MLQGCLWCSHAFQKRIGIIALVFLAIGMYGLFKSAAGLRWAHQAASQSVAYAESVTARTQTFRLIPDNTAALAAQHFQQAQTALTVKGLAQAQVELEKALSFAEMGLSRASNAVSVEKHLPLLRQCYQSYLHVLLQRHQAQPEEGFAARAWEAHDRLRWLLSNQSINTINFVHQAIAAGIRTG